jgi:eukaryotic-like serine/threonine-protein kinase
MSYKVGDVIGKYTVTRDFDSANGGQCQWGFAKYRGEEFFIKKFLDPVYPGEKAPGSEQGKQKKRDRCHEFEKKQLAIIKALSSCGDGGLVVRTIECFKHGNDAGEHYFKVSQKVDTSSMSDRVHTLELKKRLFVMLTAAGAVSILHKNGIIHLDLKPDNILIQEYGSKLIAKVIDFDSSILEGELTNPETLVGDAVYYSPEFASYIATSGETHPPTKKSDIFSLGLIFYKYWTGNLPTFSSSYNYAHEAVLKGDKLSIPKPSGETIKSEEIKVSRLSGTLIKPESATTKIDPASIGIQQLIQKMLISNPETRLSILEVHQNLKHLFHHGELPKIDTKSKLDKPKTKLSFGKNLR